MRKPFIGLLVAAALIAPISADGAKERAQPARAGEPARRVATGERVGRSVFGIAGGLASGGAYQMIGTMGQAFVQSLPTNGPFPITHRICSGWWCVEVSHLVSAPGPQTPVRIEFGLPYPNPASGNVTLDFALPHAGVVEAYLVDVSGRRVQDMVRGRFDPGRHSMAWDGRDRMGNRVHAGVYFLRLVLDGREVGRRRIVVVR